ncbi:hypothetical protein GCM10008967_08460 [Bacillus carboniphilus]|uniref:Probable DNA-directed RNA polymerase subunit delta n=1 Tax=Bacillus carboniphilus TaxID=86663 RepID=A0ABP3FME1_9BACI
MSLKNYAKEELQEMSAIELAHLLLEEKKEPMAFSDMVSEIASILERSDEQVRERISQFYTDVNIDGRFICIGENRWGLRGWYPIDQIEEETVPTIRPKKKKGKKATEDEEIVDDFDDIDEEDLDFDDLDEEYDEDELLDDDDDDEEEDEDFDEIDDDDEDFDDDEVIEEDDEYLDEDEELDEDEIDEEDDDL